MAAGDRAARKAALRQMGGKQLAKHLGKTAAKETLGALPLIGAGVDYAFAKAEGNDNQRALTRAGGSLAGGGLGAAIGTIAAPFTFGIVNPWTGAVAGSMLGDWVGKATDNWARPEGRNTTGKVATTAATVGGTAYAGNKLLKQNKNMNFNSYDPFAIGTYSAGSYQQPFDPNNPFNLNQPQQLPRRQQVPQQTYLDPFAPVQSQAQPPKPRVRNPQPQPINPFAQQQNLGTYANQAKQFAGNQINQGKQFVAQNLSKGQQIAAQGTQGAKHLWGNIPKAGKIGGAIAGALAINHLLGNPVGGTVDALTLGATNFKPDDPHDYSQPTNQLANGYEAIEQPEYEDPRSFYQDNLLGGDAWKTNREAEDYLWNRKLAYDREGYDKKMQKMAHENRHAANMHYATLRSGDAFNALNALRDGREAANRALATIFNSNGFI